MKNKSEIYRKKGNEQAKYEHEFSFWHLMPLNSRLLRCVWYVWWGWRKKKEVSSSINNACKTMLRKEGRESIKGWEEWKEKKAKLKRKAKENCKIWNCATQQKRSLKKYCFVKKIIFPFTIYIMIHSHTQKLSDV